jgi:hypothetical protein
MFPRSYAVETRIKNHDGLEEKNDPVIGRRTANDLRKILARCVFGERDIFKKSQE